MQTLRLSGPIVTRRTTYPRKKGEVCDAALTRSRRPCSDHAYCYLDAVTQKHLHRTFPGRRLDTTPQKSQDKDSHIYRRIFGALTEREVEVAGLTVVRVEADAPRSCHALCPPQLASSEAPLPAGQ